ncbi:MAG: mechanosensitive ion channel family protein [Alphaproteobacteria bacterium]|nr:mechanosensitive ion channel family protein [Alphaproteobacteria bacterium]
MRMIWLLLLCFVWGTAPAHAQVELCGNPQSATASLLDYLQPNRWEPAKAAACLDVPPEREGERKRLAIKLKKVLDAKGLYVPTSELPHDPDHVDEVGRERLQPLATLPEVYLVKKDGRWLYSRETVGLIDGMYAGTFSGISQAFQDHLPEVFFRRYASVELWQILYFLLLVGLSFLSGRIAQRLLSDQFLRLARRFGVDGPAALLERTRDPLTWLATGAVFLWGIPDLQLSVRQSQFLLLIARVITAGAFVLVAVRIVDIGADLWARKAAATASKVDDQVVPLVRRAVKVVIASVAALVVIENMGIDVAGLVAGLGIGGLAFALAAKDTLENVFGSITIFLDRPFQVGDWVVIDGNVEGVVEEVGFRTTRIRTFYNSVLSVPNGKVAMARIDNMGLRRYRRLKTTIGVTYDTPRETLDTFVDRIRTLFREDPAVWNGTLEVHFHSFGPSSLDILIYSFLDVPNWTEELKQRHRLFSGIMGIAEELGVSFAFPSQSVYVESMPEAFRQGEG